MFHFLAQLRSLLLYLHGLALSLKLLKRNHVAMSSVVGSVGRHARDDAVTGGNLSVAVDIHRVRRRKPRTYLLIIEVTR